MKASVIISTYNSPQWLEKVLWGYSVQTINDFEIIVADDGSTSETKKLLDTIKNETRLKIIHVWHKDEGFQKTRILNKAVMASRSEYLIFTDGDCVPRHDFVEAHLRFGQKGKFLSGGHFPLTIELSNLIEKDDILNQNSFDLKWLKAKGLTDNFKNIKLTKSKTIAEFMNFITTTKPTWNGGNASAWKDDIVAVNGFDERMKYGGEDREFGERLVNYGLTPRRIRYFAICIHLEHSRGYVNDEAWKINNEIRKHTRKEKKAKTLYGINLHA